MDPVTEKMATGYAGSHHDSKNTKQPSPRKLPRLLKARMGICAPDANLRCFLFKNFIQLDVKIDPRTTSELCDLLWSPPRKSPLVTRTRAFVVLHSHYVKRNNTTLLIHVHCAPGTALGTFIFSKPHDTNLTSIIITPKWQRRKLRLRS